jgi:hypothetical protein
VHDSGRTVLGLGAFVLAAALLAAGCGDDFTSKSGTASTGGSGTGAGGASASSGGAGASSGGASASSGGASASSGGASASSGGASADGGGNSLGGSGDIVEDGGVAGSAGTSTTLRLVPEASGFTTTATLSSGRYTVTGSLFEQSKLCGGSYCATGSIR